MTELRLGILAVVGLSFLSTSVAAATCESLKSVSLPGVAITSAEDVAAGPFILPGSSGNAPAPPAQPIPAHWRVKLVLKPSSDSHINAEVWLPSAEWNGKLLAVGNAGFGGAISVNGYGDMQSGLRSGYATAGNDTGHTEADGPEGMFGLGHPEKIVDFSHRAMHEMTLSAKRLSHEFYGKALPRRRRAQHVRYHRHARGVARKRFPAVRDHRVQSRERIEPSAVRISEARKIQRHRQQEKRLELEVCGAVILARAQQQNGWASTATLTPARAPADSPPAARPSA